MCRKNKRSKHKKHPSSCKARDTSSKTKRQNQREEQRAAAMRQSYGPLQKGRYKVKIGNTNEKRKKSSIAVRWDSDPNNRESLTVTDDHEPERERRSVRDALHSDKRTTENSTTQKKGGGGNCHHSTEIGKNAAPKEEDEGTQAQWEMRKAPAPKRKEEGGEHHHQLDDYPRRTDKTPPRQKRRKEESGALSPFLHWVVFLSSNGVLLSLLFLWRWRCCSFSPLPFVFWREREEKEGCPLFPLWCCPKTSSTETRQRKKMTRTKK